MALDRVKLGFAPTRRNLFSAPDAIKYANLTRNKLDELNVEYVDITDINEDGLLYDDEGVEKIAEKFAAEKIDGLFLPHCNFGTEYACARLAKKLNVPVLLWGPRDERPEADGSRLRDSQCGLFATGKVLRRFQVPFTYMKNCRLDDPEFERGVQDFLKVCNVIKTFKSIRILQIGPRPFDFWSIMCNEGELLEKFNIQLSPVPLGELYKEIDRVQAEEEQKVQEVIDFCRSHTHVEISDQALAKIAALKVAIKHLGEKYQCTAGVIQCWTDFQDELGITPYAVEAMLQDEGFPVLCETDVHGAITTLMVDAATRNEYKSMFADYTVRHPDNENGELLQHLGVFPLSTAEEKPTLIPTHFVFDYPGSVGMEAKKGEMTLCRFDGDNGEYSLLLGNAKGIEGPYNQGSYVWIEVENLNRLESKLVYGPYIHHCSAIHGNVVPILYEACKYLGIQPDFYDPIEEDVKAYLRGD
ncbi:L-fucose/L-arabinose isomerase family protein [Amphibacillus sediminis]|uniref:L-fucose/L-arabinose isomerase family protein n=1 Tax=Amphibacillus sediminis TaxID=360185 RepID=UPI00082B2313|nr:L-fucose/L-arabinose isomerase family protein [Amphibacillus sediminis]